MGNKWITILMIILTFVGGWGVKIIFTEIRDAANFELPETKENNVQVKSSKLEVTSNQDNSLVRINSQNEISIKSRLYC
jgi:hypothetical protein